MLSRVADSLYWIGRYLERAEHSIRVLDVSLNLMLERPETRPEGRSHRLMHILMVPKILQRGEPDDLVDMMCFDVANSASIAACIGAARENARQVRDEISSEQWQKLNQLYHNMMEMRSEQSYATVSDLLQTLHDGLHLFEGVTDTTMLHGEGWHFIRAGRYMERSTAIATLLVLYYPHAFNIPGGVIESTQYLEWVGLLRCCTAFEAFCTVYTTDITPERVLEFLLLNPLFPHSLRYSVNCLFDALSGIQTERRRYPSDELARRAGKLQASLSFAQIDEILEQDTAGYLRDVLEQSRMIQELIYRLYISYSVDTALAV
ncbi:alpha-E domain-containing protein [Acidobacterium sp. S8]|uniref:alpha-E domain-containing protein n=1 Tax=Acidobacterium sp. S8 TaxID=1641854 RepID=UPI00131AA8B3|nr:alpha-E domain-containing protein [Acidobacterium sp. S8]